MKTLRSLSVIAVALLAGCSLFQGPDGNVSPTRLAAISRLAAYSGTSVTLTLYPANRGDVQAAYDCLDEMVKQDTWDVCTAAWILTDHGFTNLVGEEGHLIITSGILLVDAVFGVNYDVKSNANVKAVVTGIRDGIGLALNAPKGGPWEEDLILARLKAEAKATR